MLLYHSFNNLLLSPSDHILFSIALLCHFLFSLLKPHIKRIQFYIPQEESGGWSTTRDKQLRKERLLLASIICSIFYLLNFKTSNFSKFRDPHKIKMYDFYSQRDECQWTVRGWWINMLSCSLILRYWFNAAQILYSIFPIILLY